MNNNFYSNIMQRYRNRYLDNAYKQSKKILQEEEFSYRDYNKVLKREIEAKQKEEEQRKIRIIKQNKFKGTLDDFEFHLNLIIKKYY